MLLWYCSVGIVIGVVVIVRNLTATSGLSLKKLIDPEPLYYQGKIFLTLVEKKSSLALIGGMDFQ